MHTQTIIRKLKYSLFLLALLLWQPLSLSAQVITGNISNEFGEPVPYANVFVQQNQTGTVSDDAGHYTMRLDVEGEYRLVFSSLGYESQSQEVLLTGDSLWLNIQLKTSGVELAEITVNADKRDPAFGIIRKVIDNKQAHLKALDSYRARVYVKATEEIDEKEAKKKKAAAVSLATEGDPEDPFAAEAAAQRELLNGLNMVEMELTLNYQYPNRYKEERTAYQKYGDKNGLFLPRFGETDFNFYRNLVRLNGIADLPVISPLSNTAVLSYKYELLSTDYEDGELVYKIRVIPRKSGNATVSGLIWINEGHWTINRIDFELPTGALILSDRFRIEQHYAEVADSVWMIDRQAFIYGTDTKGRVFEGSTTLRYDNIEPYYEFPDKFFGNEVAVTTQEAYERDGEYWAAGRTEKLTEREAEMVRVRDSIYAVVNSKTYKDSIQARYNKVTLLDLAWDGVGFRDHEKKTHIYVGPLASMIDFSPVGGWRVGPYASTFKRYGNGRILSNSGTLNYGLRNGDFQGDFSSWFRYDPFRLGDVSISGGRSFEAINQYDAFLNLLKPSNYILRDALRIGQQIEIANGLFIRSSFELSDRRPLTGLDVGSFVDGVVEDNDEIIDFDRYQAFISTNTISFTPGQKYMREPTRKIILGSKWPTFSLAHQKGWSGALSSDIDFDYLQLAIEQNVQVGALGNSRYRAQLGQFVNTRDLRFVDFKQFRQSDPILYSDPLHSFQSLDTSLTTTNLHFEFHHIHHFNGALINNVPLLKKTGLKVVAGGGFLWLRDGNFRHQEVFAGMERVFKLGARRRLRVGIFGVAADSSNGPPNTSFKISFDLIDTWKRDWSF
ncbi:hypothetical protein CEQ90_00515 [Lewinellaceae bacterium SD302]|nr:hypothetical protein CEQ90_00515 [Lewinellaceae bacterium SD302]